MDRPCIEREIDIDLPSDDVWELVSTAEGWRRWLVDDVDIDVREGATGSVTDDAVRRAVAVEHVGDGQVRFVWTSGDGDASRVTLIVDQSLDRPRLRITEQWLSATACRECAMRAGGRWDLRACVLCLQSLAACRA